MSNSKILLIDDHPMFRSGIKLILVKSEFDVTILEAGSLHEALQIDSSDLNLILLDVKLNGINGIDGLFLLKQKWPEVPVIILSSNDKAETKRLAISKGAVDFVSKGETAEKIVTRLRQALKGQLDPVSDSVTSESTLGLTPRQTEVLDMLCLGLSNKLIARKMNLSENTVRRHIQAILSNFGVSTRAEAVYQARIRGVIN